MTVLWCRNTVGGCLLLVHVQPGSRETAVVGEHGGMLKMRLAAPPVDGKANDALIAWLSEQTGVARRRITIKGGASSRRKTLVLDGVTAVDLQAALISSA